MAEDLTEFGFDLKGDAFALKLMFSPEFLSCLQELRMAPNTIEYLQQLAYHNRLLGACANMHRNECITKNNKLFLYNKHYAILSLSVIS